MEGYFLVHRSLMESDLWLKKKFTYGQAWVDLIYLASFRDSYILVRNIKVEIKRGQVGLSTVKLAERWHWTRDELRTYLNILESTQQITQQKSNITTIISIVNYIKYQEPHSKIPSKPTANPQQTHSRNLKTIDSIDSSATERRIKKEKNNIDTFSQNNGQLSIANLLADLILRNNPTNRDLNPGHRENTVEKWSHEIDKMIRLDKRNPDYIKQVIVWAENDTFWMKNILSASSLRKHFDKLHMASKKTSRPGYDENGIPNKVIL